jgi:hypothetical protein
MAYLPAALSVTLRFIFWFGILPYLLLPRTMATLERLVLGFFIAMAGSVTVAQGLSAIGLWEPFTAWSALVIVLGVAMAPSLEKDSWARRTLSRAEFLQQTGVWVPFRRYLNESWQRIRSSKAVWRHPDFLTWLLCAVMLGWTAWLRYSHYLRHLFLTASDGYLHLSWVKYLERIPVTLGVPTHLFQDGVYPYGYHAVLSVLSFLNSLDPHAIIRFVGPIAGVLLVLSIGYAVHRAGARPGAVVIAMSVLALTGNSPLPASAVRMISPLPQEFSAIFVLPGAVAAWWYLRANDRPALWVALLAAFLTASIHTYSLVYLALAVAVIAVVGWVMAAVPFRRVLNLGLMSAGAVAAGTAPMGAGLLLGIKFHRSFSYAVSQVQRLPVAPGWERLWTANPFLNAGLVAAALLLAGGVVAIIRGERDRAPIAVSVSVILVLLFTQTYGRTGIPVLMDPGRSGLFLSLFLALAVGLVADAVLRLVRAGALVQPLVVVLVIVPMVVQWWPTPPTQMTQYEYDNAVAAYLAVKDQYQRGSWTIVAPQDQLPELLGIGYHTQIFKFARENTVDQLSRPTYHLATRFTGDMFVFIEKWPLGSAAPIQPDASVLLPAGVSEDDINDLYYHEPEGRSLVEARTWGLMEAYVAAHPEEVKVFWDDDRLRVYHINMVRN